MVNHHWPSPSKSAFESQQGYFKMTDETVLRVVLASTGKYYVYVKGQLIGKQYDIDGVLKQLNRELKYELECKNE